MKKFITSGLLWHLYYHFFFQLQLDFEVAWITVQILIRWLCQKPSDLDLHCFLKKIYYGSAGHGLNNAG